MKPRSTRYSSNLAHAGCPYRRQPAYGHRARRARRRVAAHSAWEGSSPRPNRSRTGFLGLLSSQRPEIDALRVRHPPPRAPSHTAAPSRRSRNHPWQGHPKPMRPAQKHRRDRVSPLRHGLVFPDAGPLCPGATPRPSSWHPRRSRKRWQRSPSPRLPVAHPRRSSALMLSSSTSL